MDINTCTYWYIDAEFNHSSWACNDSDAMDLIANFISFHSIRHYLVIKPGLSSSGLAFVCVSVSVHLQNIYKLFKQSFKLLVEAFCLTKEGNHSILKKKKKKKTWVRVVAFGPKFWPNDKEKEL